MKPAMFSLGEAAAALTGCQLHGDPGIAVSGVSTDSRAAGPGDLFFALRGERFDAHDFLPQVAAQHALAAVVSRRDASLAMPQLVVADTRIALGELARAWRRRFSIPVIAVTGSNGKTTVKEMLAVILAAAVGEQSRLATRGNLNNDIGLPLTLFGMHEGHRLAVLELGMNHPGETGWLANIAQPTVALVNNAQREHQEFMVSVEAVATEHAAVIAALPANGTAVFPAESAYAGHWREVAGARQVLDFGMQDGAVRGRWAAAADAIELIIETPAGQCQTRLSVLGEHNVMNALAATAAALGAGVPLSAIDAGLRAFQPVKGRLQRHQCGMLTLVDDTYNANPDSVRAAIDVLSNLPGRKILVLGDMGEVGANGEAFHEEVGAYARERGIDRLMAVGTLAQAAARAFGAGERFSETGELLAAWPGLGVAGESAATVLVKGSRFMRMERIIDAVLAASTTLNTTMGAGAHGSQEG